MPGTISQFGRFPNLCALHRRDQIDGTKTSATSKATWRSAMNGIIYLIGLIVVIMAILSFLGLR
jgi:hypothetical protein